MIGYGDKVKAKLDIAAGINRYGKVFGTLPDGNLLVRWPSGHEADYPASSLELAYPES